MKPVNMLKLKWLLTKLDTLNPKDKSHVMQVCEKCYNNLSQVTSHCWGQIDNIYDKIRNLTGTFGGKTRGSSL